MLLAHVKLDLKAEILRTDVPDLPEFADLLAAQFPAALAGRFPDAVAAHPLRREIVATTLVNELVNRGGITFAHRLAEDVDGTPADAVRAFRVATADLRAARALVRRSPRCRSRCRSRWSTGSPSSPAGCSTTPPAGCSRTARGRWASAPRSDRFAPAVRALLPTLPTLLRGAEAAAAADRAAELVGQGVPAAAGAAGAALRHASGLLDVVETGAQAGPLPLDQVARLYFALSERWSAAAPGTGIAR